jgi:PIN like domain
VRVLLDEDVPVQLLEPLRHLTHPRHTVEHAAHVRLKGRKDVSLFRLARERGYECVVTNDHGQLFDPRETRAIARSGLHHVRYKQRHEGLRGLAFALGALIAVLPGLLDDLERETGQRLLRVQSFDPSHKRYEMMDPASDPQPPAYWPRRKA